MNLLASYKDFVRRNSGLVINLERLAHWVAWSPERFSGSEFGYEAWNAAVGLLGLYNDSILDEDGPGAGEPSTDYAFMLAALEQVCWAFVLVVCVFVTASAFHIRATRCVQSCLRCVLRCVAQRVCVWRGVARARRSLLFCG
jgi:hypothetical protein